MAQHQREPRAGYVAVGIVVRPWGLAGDLKVESLTDFPDRFEPGAILWLGAREHRVERSRWQKGALYLKLNGINDVPEAESVRGELLEVPEASLHALPEGDYYDHQLTGLAVRTLAGEPLGAVREVLHPGGNAVLVVHGDRGEILVPFIDDVVRRVDLSSRHIDIDPIDGMLPETKARAPRPPGAYARRRARRATNGAGGSLPADRTVDQDGSVQSTPPASSHTPLHPGSP